MKLSAHWRHRHFQELIQPRGLRAPEVILGYHWDTPADIWNVGCLVGPGMLHCRYLILSLSQVTELLVGFWLFEANVEDQWGIEEDHLARMTEALNTSFDVNFLRKCEHRDRFFKANGTCSGCRGDLRAECDHLHMFRWLCSFHSACGAYMADPQAP